LLNGSGHLRTGDRAFSEGSAALRAKELIEFAGGQDEQEFLPNGLESLAFGTIKFARGKCSELFSHGSGQNCRDDAQNLLQYINRGLGCVNVMHQVRTIIIKHRLGVALVSFQTVPDNF
jgi:hypothetical protein